MALHTRRSKGQTVFLFFTGLIVWPVCEAGMTRGYRSVALAGPRQQSFLIALRRRCVSANPLGPPRCRARRIDCTLFCPCGELIDSYIDFAAPLSPASGLSPFFTASAIPAAICCAFDFAGI